MYPGLDLKEIEEINKQAVRLEDILALVVRVQVRSHDFYLTASVILPLPESLN